MGPSPAREEGRAVGSVGSHGCAQEASEMKSEVKFGLFAVEHSRRMSSNGQHVEQERSRLVMYTSLGDTYIHPLYATQTFCVRAVKQWDTCPERLCSLRLWRILSPEQTKP